MRFLLDESADYPLADLLRSLGHEVTAIVHDYPRSLTDREVLAIAVQEQRVLITNDTDFGELIVRHQLPHAGVVLFRLHDERLEAKQARLAHVLRAYAADLRQFLVVTDRRVRVRRG